MSWRRPNTKPAEKITVSDTKKQRTAERCAAFSYGFPNYQWNLLEGDDPNLVSFP